MKVSIINGVCVHRDAISESVYGTYLALSQIADADCRIFTYATDYTNVNVRIVSSSADIMMDPHFVDSDLIVFHFGIYYELFNLILVGNGRAAQIVFFHNVTPRQFLDVEQHALALRSIDQIANMSAASEIIAMSSFNKQLLVDYGLNESRISVLPLYVKSCFTNDGCLVKPRDRVRILFVGRFVSSKGLMDLIDAAGLVRSRVCFPFSVTLVGNLSFSDLGYLERMRVSIARQGLEDIIDIIHSPTDQELWQIFIDSHIFVMPSYHEGFCVPALEALRAHCVVLAYAAGNLPDLLDGVGEVTEIGDKAALADKLLYYIEFFHNRSLDDPQRVPVGGETLSLEDFEKRIERHLQQYTFESFGVRLRSTVDSLLGRLRLEPRILHG